MANKNLFNPNHAHVAKTNHVNRAGGKAYQMDAEVALAKAAVTGTFSDTFHADAEMQFDDVVAYADAVAPEFVAKTAVYARKRGHMKDMPAFLAAWLHGRGEIDLLKAVFPRVVDNGRMLRNFVQIVRSGLLGRRSFGHATKRLIQDWIAARHPAQLFADSIGKEPSLADVIRMVHPKAANAEREALHGYLLGRPHDAEALPEVVKAYEAWKADPADREVPKVPFQMLTFRDDLPKNVWASIADHAPWHMTRMNLNTFARHGVFEDRRLTKRIARRLADADAVRRARVFPYQLMVAYRHAQDGVPRRVRNALQDALEVATENAPSLGRVAVAVDTSGSMRSPATGYRPGATSVVRCVDVAALVAAVVMRKNPEARILPFDTEVHRAKLNPRDSVMTNAAKLAKFGGGGTDCSAAMSRLNRDRTSCDVVIYVSDNQSWADYVDRRYWHGTGLETEWRKYKGRVNPRARLVLIDLQPYRSVQAMPGGDTLLVGGFSDAVFDVIHGWLSAGENGAVATVEKTEL